MINGAKEEGIEEGENRKAIKVAENFLRMGLTIEQVAQGSELPIEKIIELKNKMIN
jgi:predicted transposase YdaD